MNEQDKIYKNIILEYMLATTEKYQNEILQIKRDHFYNKFNTDDYYNMLIAQVRLENCINCFSVIRDFLNFMN